jgi:sugar/nucleoside kinase (ribokinase family)
VLAVVGDLLEDIVVRIAGAPAVGTDTPATIERRRGGSAANVAVAAATAGARVRFIGCVGIDDIGVRLADEVRAAGVDVRVQRRGHTGAVVVLIATDGERTMLPDRAAATSLVDVPTAWLDGVEWLHVPSYSLLSEPIGTTVTGMVADVRGRGARVSVDVSSVSAVEAFGVERYQALLARLSPDVVFANEPESELLPTNLDTLAIIKHGPRPVEVGGTGARFTVDVPPLSAVRDTTGAGDALAAGFLAATLDGADAGDAVAAGIELAVRLLQRR